MAVLVPEFSASAMSSLGATGSIKALPSANVKALALVRVANPPKKLDVLMGKPQGKRGKYTGHHRQNMEVLWEKSWN